MAVRESLTRLLGEGLVTLGEKGGYFVTSFTQAGLYQLRELREILEVGALRLALDKVSKDQINKLEKICQDFTSMREQGYFSGANEADLKFHETLIECSGNEKLIQAYNNSHIPLFHQQLIKGNSSENDFELTDKEHRAILKAIKARNVDLAEKNIRLHFARGADATSMPHAFIAQNGGWRNRDARCPRHRSQKKADLLTFLILQKENGKPGFHLHLLKNVGMGPAAVVK